MRKRRRPPFRGEATDAGYFPPTSGLLLNSWSPPIDFTNPAATAWWQGLLGRYTSLGIEGFKLDYGEDVTVGIAGGRTAWLFHDGRDERTAASSHFVQYHQTYAKLLPSDGGFLLCRAGHWGDQVNGPIILAGRHRRDDDVVRRSAPAPGWGDAPGRGRAPVGAPGRALA